MAACRGLVHRLGVRVMELDAPGPVETRPLREGTREDPMPAAGEIRVRVEACGVCRTDLHVVEGELAPERARIVPGHEVVGRVEACGDGVDLVPGARVGIPWLRSSCGRCRFCRRSQENLCLVPRFTGWHADGGYAESCIAPADFVHPLPEQRDARELAPLLCAGIIGYRAFLRSGVEPGGRLGLFGFGGSAHIALQVAAHAGCELNVFTRGGTHRELAEELGATWIGKPGERPPHPLDGAILFAPEGELVPAALETLDRGAALAIAGIHLSAIPSLDYQTHLFQERELRSVTANTREDARALLSLAEEIPIRTHTVAYPLDQANEALIDLKADRVRGAAVLVPGH